MSYAESRPLLLKPPLCPTRLTPESVYSQENYALLRVHLKATLGCRTEEDFNKAVKPFSPDERSKVAGMLLQAREIGFYPEAVTDSGIAWGVATKSDLQVEFERNWEKYEARGEQIKAYGLDIFKGIE